MLYQFDQLNAAHLVEDKRVICSIILTSVASHPNDNPHPVLALSLPLALSPVYSIIHISNLTAQYNTHIHNTIYTFTSTLASVLSFAFPRDDTNISVHSHMHVDILTYTK